MADDWETYNGDDQSLKCFKYFPSQQYATTAEKDCQALGGHLASIHSLEEKKFIDKMVSDDFWIGGVDVNKNGQWGWTDGSKWDYTYWMSNQPNGEEYYLIVAGKPKWDWRDWEFNNKKSYVCQLTVIKQRLLAQESGV